MTERRELEGSYRAFDAWWRGLTRKGDPERNPNLVREAFHAGYMIARAESGADGVSANPKEE